MGDLGKKLIAAGFQRPKGPMGRLGGRLMAQGNGATERHVVDVAACCRDETVLVVGPGPGLGVQPALEVAAEVIAVDPSPLMLEMTLRRCRGLMESGARLTLRNGTAEEPGVAEESVDVVLSVNNAMIWPDRRTGLAAVFRVLRPGGRMLLSAHRKWLGEGLADDCWSVGFERVEQWTWEPPGRGATTAIQLRAWRPVD